MMKANDLIMGFYVRLNRNIFPFIKGEILKIFSYDAAEFMKDRALCESITGNHYFIWIDALDPIPLTEDILKKIGFEKTKLVIPSYILCENSFTVFAKKNNDGTWIIDVLKNDFNLPDQSAIMCNVHQLQQWLRFCGIEREIEMSSLTSINTI